MEEHGVQEVETAADSCAFLVVTKAPWCKV